MYMIYISELYKYIFKFIIYTDNYSVNKEN